MKFLDQAKIFVKAGEEEDYGRNIKVLGKINKG